MAWRLHELSSLQGGSNPFHYPLIPGIEPETETIDANDVPMFEDQTAFFSSPTETGFGLEHHPAPPHPQPQYIQPQDLHGHHRMASCSASSTSSTVSTSSSPEARSPQLDPAAIIPTAAISNGFGLATLQHSHSQAKLRRLSLPPLDDAKESYRPRNTPARSRKSSSSSGSTSRITPRSQKHARELELNRKAASKCRNRHKAYVEDLQTRCRTEEERLHAQTSLLHALHDEVLVLRTELLRQSLCGCQSLSNSAAAGLPGVA